MPARDRPRPSHRLLRPAFGLLAAVLLALTARAAPPALPGVDARWQEIRSPNFTLYSNQSDAESRALLHDLEILRAVFAERFRFVERARQEVSVYAFRSRKEFEAYSPRAGGKKRTSLGGFYLPYPDRSVIVVAPAEDRDEARRTIFHEYVHHLFRVAEQNPPVWFNEGMAELLAGIRIKGDQVEIGHPQVGRLLNLRQEKLLALETLFTVTRGSMIYRSDEHTGVFYAQSWALLHYWYCGKSDLSREGIARFISIATAPVPPTFDKVAAAFEECFGMTFAQMNKRLEAYMLSGSYGYSSQPAPEVAPATSYEAVVLPANRVRVRLGELAFRVNRSPAGEAAVREAVVSDPQDFLPLELLGAVAASEDDSATAAAYWEKAVAAGTPNVGIMRELALIEARTWFEDFDYGLRLPKDVTERLRTRLLRSIKHEPQQSAAYEMLAWVEAFSEDRSIANLNLVQAQFNRLPNRARTLVALAMVRVRMDAKDAALTLLKAMPGVQPDPWSLQAAEVITANLEGRPVQMLGDSTRGTQVDTEYGPKVESTRRLPSVPLPPDL